MENCSVQLTKKKIFVFDFDRLNDDTFMMLVSILISTPRALLRFLHVVRAKCNVSVWMQVWKLYNELLQNKEYFNVEFSRLVNTKIRYCALHYETILGLVHRNTCEVCGFKINVPIVHDYLKKVVCGPCLQDNYISNVVLYYRYGIQAHALVHKWGMYIRYYPLKKHNSSWIQTYTREQVDYEPWNMIMFFWLPDIKKFLDLEYCALLQSKRFQSVNVIKAMIKRLCVVQNADMKHRDLRWLYHNELCRVRLLSVDSKWVPGSNVHPNSRQPTCSLLQRYYVMPIVAGQQINPKLFAQRNQMRMCGHWQCQAEDLMLFNLRCRK